MFRTNLTKLYVGEDYATAEETSADIEAKVFRNTPITTTQRNLIVALQGMEIFNSTTNQPEFFNGSAWVAA